MVTVQRRTVSGKGQAGGERPQYGATSASIACAVFPASSSVRLEAAQRDMVIDSEVYFASDPQLDNGDRLDFMGRTLIVQAVRRWENTLFVVTCRDKQ
jgi:hypothetical protein